MFKLYDYQAKMRHDIYSAIRQGKKNILAIAVTGSSKPVFSCWIMRECVVKVISRLGHS